VAARVATTPENRNLMKGTQSRLTCNGLLGRLLAEANHATVAPCFRFRSLPLCRFASCSLLGLGVDCSALEINPHERLLPDDPGVMSRGDYPNVFRPELDLGAVVHSDTHTP
jgi:hypothetical protein